MSKRFLPQLGNGQVELTPNFPALARVKDTTISGSTEITLNADTSVLEITAVLGNVFMKYGADDVTNANFDEFILANTTRHYVVPAGVTKINLIDDGDSATVVVIEK